MKDYIDDMLHLTADIAEELLALKDSGRDVDEELCRKIRRLSFLADSNLTDNPDDRIEEITDSMIRDRAAEIMADTASEPQPTLHVEPEAETIETDALVEEARRQAELSEEKEEMETDTAGETSWPIAQAEANGTNAEPDANSCNSTETDADTEAEALSAISEENAEAGTEAPATQPHMPLVTASQLRNAFTLNDMFLYRRTLFRGSPEWFNEALAHIASLRSTHEIKAYLSEIWHINIKTDEAKDFIDTISQFFNE